VATMTKERINATATIAGGEWLRERGVVQDHPAVTFVEWLFNSSKQIPEIVWLESGGHFERFIATLRPSSLTSIRL